MPDRPPYTYDAAPATCIGQRDRQEDAVAFHAGTDQSFGFVVLADGMGGHAAGDVASGIVVSEITKTLKSDARSPEQAERNISRLLSRAVTNANEHVGRVARENPQSRGMGATVLAPVLFENRLYWVSVGDSPLYLFRGSQLFRLNENHSVAGRMQKLVKRGQMSPAAAAEHPDRHCLTSVLIGTAIPEIDIRTKPVTLQDNDIVIAASDGLQAMGEHAIARTLFQSRFLPSADIACRLLQSIFDFDDPHQDNVSFCVLKVTKNAPANSHTSDSDKSLSTHYKRAPDEASQTANVVHQP